MAHIHPPTLVLLVTMLGCSSPDVDFNGSADATKVQSKTNAAAAATGSISGHVALTGKHVEASDPALPRSDYEVEAPFADDYVALKLGLPAGIPAEPIPQIGGISLLPSDPNIMLIGVSTNRDGSNWYERIYKVRLKRDASQRIAGFAGPAEVAFDLPAQQVVPPKTTERRMRVDGGNAFSSDGILFLVTFPAGVILQYDQNFNLLPKADGVVGDAFAGEGGALNFVPAWHPAAGQAKLLVFERSTDNNPNHAKWLNVTTTKTETADRRYTLDFVETGIRFPDQGNESSGGEGFAYVPQGSPKFSKPSMVVAEWAYGRIETYEVDDNADPILSTRRVILRNTFKRPEGSYFDAASGDLIFSSWPNQSAGEIILLRGFKGEVDEANPAKGTVVFLDLNRNGKQDKNEPVAKAAVDGSFAFKNLSPDKYRVRALAPDGYSARANMPVYLDVEIKKDDLKIDGLKFVFER